MGRNTIPRRSVNPKEVKVFLTAQLSKKEFLRQRSSGRYESLLRLPEGRVSERYARDSWHPPEKKTKTRTHSAVVANTLDITQAGKEVNKLESRAKSDLLRVFSGIPVKSILRKICQEVV